MAKAQLYNEALKELESIISDIESETIDVDLLAKKVKRATELIKTCKLKLKKTEKELETVLKEFEEEGEADEDEEDGDEERKEKIKSGAGLFDEDE